MDDSDFWIPRQDGLSSELHGSKDVRISILSAQLEPHESELVGRQVFIKMELGSPVLPAVTVQNGPEMKPIHGFRKGTSIVYSRT